MPEFVLDHGDAAAARTFRQLDSFTQGYITAAFFTSTGTADDREEDLESASFAELAPEALARMVRDCERFQRENAAALSLAEELDSDCNAEEAGIDFWMTRNGHGVGFWDKSEWPSPAGEQLDQAAKVYGNCDLYRGDDGRIYVG